MEKIIIKSVHFNQNNARVEWEWNGIDGYSLFMAEFFDKLSFSEMKDCIRRELLKGAEPPEVDYRPAWHPYRDK